MATSTYPAPIERLLQILAAAAKRRARRLGRRKSTQSTQIQPKSS